MGKAVTKTKGDISKRWESVMQANYGTPSIELVHGKGIEVWDSHGKKYLDFLGGIATNLLGHSHATIGAAISTQARSLSHISNFYAHEQGLALARELQDMAGDSSARIFFWASVRLAHFR